MTFKVKQSTKMELENWHNLIILSIIKKHFLKKVFDFRSKIQLLIFLKVKIKQLINIDFLSGENDFKSTKNHP